MVKLKINKSIKFNYLNSNIINLNSSQRKYFDKYLEQRHSSQNRGLFFEIFPTSNKKASTFLLL